jgi:hypothetical protein
VKINETVGLAVARPGIKESGGTAGRPNGPHTSWPVMNTTFLDTMPAMWTLQLRTTTQRDDYTDNLLGLISPGRGKYLPLVKTLTENAFIVTVHFVDRKTWNTVV